MDHAPNIPRRPINYTSRGGDGSEVSEENSGVPDERKREYRPLRIYVGDMIQVVDPKSHLCGKFGLVAEIHPKNLQFNVIMKIGSVRNPVKFSQIRFCTRLNSDEKNINNENITEATITEKQMVNELIDTIDEEDDDIGNREGANLKHGIKL